MQEILFFLTFGKYIFSNKRQLIKPASLMISTDGISIFCKLIAVCNAVLLKKLKISLIIYYLKCNKNDEIKNDVKMKKLE